MLPPLAAKNRRNRNRVSTWPSGWSTAANPLTARVAMNRFWRHHFGIGIVETENDFGTQGTPPSHPELLDWLASEFIASEAGASRRCTSLIVMSATYRQSSKARPDLAIVDPRNRLLARQAAAAARRPRSSATWRLAASGLLTPKIGGPSVFPPQPDGVYRFTQIDTGLEGEHRARTAIAAACTRISGARPRIRA